MKTLTEIAFNYIIKSYDYYQNRIDELPNELKENILDFIKKVNDMQPDELVINSKNNKAMCDYILANNKLIEKLGGQKSSLWKFFREESMDTEDKRNILYHDMFNGIYLYTFCNDSYVYPKAKAKGILGKLNKYKRAYLEEKFGRHGDDTVTKANNYHK